ncbi:MAG: SOS response-associated peptidase [Candidatus Sulfotelmatobacter sp.]
MCGRYRLTAKERYLRDHFELDEDPTWTPRWNIAPTQLVPIVRQKSISSGRSFDLVRWGLIPSWAKDASIATKTINAMSETAADKPAFRDALRLRRCLIPANSFYEWQASGPKHKQPFSKSRGVLDTRIQPTLVVISLQNRRHAPMNVGDEGIWGCSQDCAGLNDIALSDCLEPFDAALMKKYPVSTRVNRPENDDHVCAQEITVAATPTLF